MSKMTRNQFNYAIDIVSRSFNIQKSRGGKITISMLNSMIEEAERNVKESFPQFSDEINISLIFDTEEDFSGYEFSVGDMLEIAEFDFGEYGVDIV